MSKYISHEDLEFIASAIKRELSSNSDLSFSRLELKGNNDAVTDLDMALQNKIFNIIAGVDPGVSCISEESNAPPVAKQDECWIIDPLDGTSNLIQGLRPSAISIAKVSGKNVLAAMVLDLSTNDLYTAVKSKGARLNSNVLTTKSDRIKLIGLSTGYIKNGGIIPDECNGRIIGSQALQLCLVAVGSLCSTISLEAKAWDDVAGSLIVEESGGTYVNECAGRCWIDLAISKRSLCSKAISSSADKSIRKIILGLKND